MVVDKWATLFEIRKAFNVEVDKLRKSGVVGKNLELVLVVEYYGNIEEVHDDVLASLMDPTLLSTICNASQAIPNIIWPKVNCLTDSISFDVHVIQCQKLGLHACPRCMKYHNEINYDKLCNRCVNVMKTSFPNHEATLAMLEQESNNGI